MTKAAAIQAFWASFGLAAYEENAVPADAAYPYITYELVTDAFGGETSMSGSLWYHGPSWIEANAKAEEISDRIGYAGKILHSDSGYIWIRCGVPFAQSMGDPDDDMIRRKVLNITATFYTRN